MKELDRRKDTSTDEIIKNTEEVDRTELNEFEAYQSSCFQPSSCPMTTK